MKKMTKEDLLAAVVLVGSLGMLVLIGMRHGWYMS